MSNAQPSWVRASHPQAKANQSQQIEVKVYLANRNQAQLAAQVQAVTTPGSSQYGHYLTPAQFRAAYSPTNADLAKVEAFLSANGLHVTEVPANRHYVTAVGTVAAAQKAFATSLDVYSHNGRAHRAAATGTSVPASLANLVIGVAGLADSSNPMKPSTSSNLPGPPPGFRNAPPCSQYYGQKTASTLPKAFGMHQPYAPCGYVPSQLQGAYGIAGAVAKGIDGRGYTVAITDAYAAPTIRKDANTYATRHGQPAFTHGQFKQVLPNKPYRLQDLCGPQGWYGEETLDVEAVHAMAPGAKVTYVAARSCDDIDLDDALNKIVDNHLADIITNSWGGLEIGETSALLNAYQQTFFQAALEGISVLFSSGDNGDESTGTPNGKPSADFPASHPLVTAVGGTSLAVYQNNKYGFETGWGTGKSTLTNGKWVPAPPGAWLYGAGGGVSQIFRQPWYQKGVVPNSIARQNGKLWRVVPDIAMDADPNTGMLVGETQVFPNGVMYGEYRIGGTSLASPLFAGILALANQVGGRPHGFANPAIYALAGTNALHDITGGRMTDKAVVRVDYVNSVNNAAGTVTSLRSLGYLPQSIYTRPGYDDVTGVGTPNGPTFLGRLGYQN